MERPATIVRTGWLATTSQSPDSAGATACPAASSRLLRVFALNHGKPHRPISPDSLLDRRFARPSHLEHYSRGTSGPHASAGSVSSGAREGGYGGAGAASGGVPRRRFSVGGCPRRLARPARTVCRGAARSYAFEDEGIGGGQRVVPETGSTERRAYGFGPPKRCGP